jgi:DNA-binding transcriptional LysR family regulator
LPKARGGRFSGDVPWWSRRVGPGQGAYYAPDRQLAEVDNRPASMTANLAGIDVNLLVALRAVLRAQTVSGAARSVGLAQSSMSHALARLREHFGDPLLVRSGGKMVLTERARWLVQPVEEATAQLERVFSPSATFDPATSDRRFEIVATDNIEVYLLPRLMPLLAREAPQVRLRIHQLPEDWMRALSAGEADLKLGRQYPIPDRFHSEELFEERFTCVVRQGHPFRSDHPSLKDFVEMSHIAVVPGSVAGGRSLGFVDELLAQRGLQRRVALTISHFLVAPHLVAASDLALTASERLIAPFLGPLRLRTLRLPLAMPTYRLSQVWAKRSHADASHRWLRQIVARAARG